MTEENAVLFKCNGKIFEGWLSVSVSRSLRAVSGSFDLEYIDQWDTQEERFQIKNGVSCVLMCGDDVLITGYVDKVSFKFEATKRTLRVSGRDKTADLVDSSCEDSAKSFKGVSLLSMAKKLAGPFSVGVVSKSPKANTIIEKASTQVGATIWETIDKLARYQGVLAYPDGQGNLIFSDVENTLSFSFSEGQNILSLDYEVDDSQKYQTYKVAITVGDPNSKHRVEVLELKDQSVKRPRIKEVVVNKSGTRADAQARAEWERMAAQARALKMTITVYSWKNGQASLYNINSLAKITAPSAGLDGVYLVESVQYKLDGNSMTCELTLVLKEAYSPEATSDYSA